MPNWITNRIRVNPAHFAEVKEILLDDEGEVDFNRLIPMPPWMDTLSISMMERENPRKWFEWSRAHWGTKWSAKHTVIKDELCEIAFDTAWQHPEPVIEELSRLLPHVNFAVIYAEEDLGYGQRGAYYIRNLEKVPSPAALMADDGAWVANWDCLVMRGEPLEYSEDFPASENDSRDYDPFDILPGFAHLIGDEPTFDPFWLDAN
ncbi:hypothetical protein MHK03_06030 [Corynebacterium simulans]|uniref:DUF1281 family ferredoxin-like fold protein n=1 Tax=Corynebacterium simulans TaxID=146827 RepID=UPI001EF164C1|nr:hypothetical protein [Corynebacterium simulans]MCG7247483.1 hypothetical protein [Corynebacterium simulans]